MINNSMKNFVEKLSIKNNPKVVVVGGGTGLSVLLRGLKKLTPNITAIVTVADDGGGSGILRQEMGMLPPGDIRNCMVALAEVEPLFSELINYRFTEGSLKGQSFGNLFLAAMNGISPNFETAVHNMSNVLKVRGRVLPVTVDNVNLEATLVNGEKVLGESRIPEVAREQNSKIKKTSLVPADVNPIPEALEAIAEADLIILGPGSLYTSIIPNLLVKGVPEAIYTSKAPTVYVCNIMTQPFETSDYTAYDHYKAIIDHSYKTIIDYCVVNSTSIDDVKRDKYSKEGSIPVKVDIDKFKDTQVQILEADLINPEDPLAHHDTEKLAKLLISICKSKR